MSALSLSTNFTISLPRCFCWFNPLLVLKINERCVAYGYTATKLADEMRAAATDASLEIFNLVPFSSML